MFQPVESSVSFPKVEEQVGQFWKDRAVYEKSLAARAEGPAFVFYEGPPTANGLPHPGHCLTRAIKDLFPRYRTMRGYRCQRKAGWDTHGLPVEVEVCKELGIHSKEEIEAFGVEPFIRKCLESVFRYTREWEQLTERLGFWIHLDEAYVTYHQSYVESVWWSLKSLFDRGLLYQGYKIVWWWAQGGTALSSGEVGQGYREVADPSVFVRFPLVPDAKAKSLSLDENTSLLVWTTTPWTLPANQFAAVKPDLTYLLLVDPTDANKRLIVAESLAGAIIEKVQRSRGEEQLGAHSDAKQPAVVCNPVRTYKGEQLVGLRYKPPFEGFWNAGPLDAIIFPGSADIAEAYRQLNNEVRSSGPCVWMSTFKIVGGDFVTTDSGTGAVHIAPAFGEVDFEVLSEKQREADASLGLRARPTLICNVAPDGKFTADLPEYKGRWVKDCDRDIIRQLKAEGKLFHQEQYLHDYPFCWRAEEDPLIQYPRKSWFIRTTAFKEKMLENNSHINWLPEHIKEGRFGNFLETNVDWALSRERYWGTPLPIWRCSETGRMEAVGSYTELLAKPGVQGVEVWENAKRQDPTLADDLKVHKPYIDAITYSSPFDAHGRMERVPEVIDCWFDSGAMPFAQWGYPHKLGSAERFRDQFPADFISEALDQTRGWFYSQLAISTLMFSEGAGNEGRGTGNEKSEVRGQKASVGQTSAALSPLAFPYPHPFRNCIVLGLMLGEDGQKMSKSKRNYRDPGDIFNLYGADALRWYFFANQPPWTSIRYSEQAIKDCIPEFLLRLWNVYSFFVIYANIDGFDPAAAFRGAGVQPGQLGPDVLAKAKGYRPVAERGELDRWILSELSRTVRGVVERMDAYDNFNACARLTEFVDALSNWYVRRSRDRFWSSGKADESTDKTDAYWTLYECLLTTCKLIAPFVPFLAEAMWQNLAVAAFGGEGSLAAIGAAASADSGPTCRRPLNKDGSLPSVAESVHLCDYPTADPAAIDEDLSARMTLMREVVSLGRSARMGAKLKVRQPLSRVEVVLADATHQPWLEEHASLICDELNVKSVEFTGHAEQYITYTVLPDLKRLGPKLGKRLPALRKALSQADAAKLLAELEASGTATLSLSDGPVTLSSDDIQVRLQAKEGWAASQGRSVVVVLSTELTDELILEGLARELVRTIQDRRKEMGCQFTDRIELGFETESAELWKAIDQFKDYICGETLATLPKAAPAMRTAALFSTRIPGAEVAETEIAGHKLTLSIRIA